MLAYERNQTSHEPGMVGSDDERLYMHASYIQGNWCVWKARGHLSPNKTFPEQSKGSVCSVHFDFSVVFLTCHLQSNNALSFASFG